MKKLIIITLLLSAFAGLKAQQEAQFSHYSFNTQAINPAYAGSRDALTVTGLHRSQWVGFEGAPITQTLTAHAPILNDKLGLGLSVLNDKIGPTNNTSLFADFAYRLPVSEKGVLAFGLKAGINIAKAGLSDLTTTQGGDQNFSTDISSGLAPNFGAGLYYHTDTWYAGISVPRILENTLGTDSRGGNIIEEQRHYWFIAGTVFPLSESIKLKPTTFLQVTEGAPIVLDLTGMFIFHEKLELGGLFRTGDAVGVLAGYNVNPQFRIGYSFDYSYTNTTFRYNGGSHEIMLRYDFIFKENKKIISPRYF